MFYNMCNEYTTSTRAWIEKYRKYGWEGTGRGQFPFDVQKWVVDLIALFEE